MDVALCCYEESCHCHHVGVLNVDMMNEVHAYSDKSILDNPLKITNVTSSPGTSDLAHSVTIKGFTEVMSWDLEVVSTVSMVYVCSQDRTLQTNDSWKDNGPVIWGDQRPNC